MAHQSGSDPHWGSLQQILDGELSNLTDGDLAVENIVKVRRRLDRYSERLEHADDRTQLGRPGARDGHDDDVRPCPFDNRREVASRPVHLDAVDPTTHLCQIIVSKPNRLVRALAIVKHVADDRFPGVARAVDEHSTALVEIPQFAPYSPRQSQPPKHAEQEDEIVEKHGPRVDRQVEEKADN